MQSFSNEQSPNGRNLRVFLRFLLLSFWCIIFVSEKLFRNLTNFYHNAPTRDIRLVMQSFSNEQSPNGRNLRNLTNFYHNAPTGDIILFMQSFSNEHSRDATLRISTTMLLQVI
ncbi:hypothetical protein OROHE_020704 [Orobanche hederae]